MKFAYVIEDGEIIKKQEIAKLGDELESTGNLEVAEYLIDRYFEEQVFSEIDWEVNGLLFTVSETEMVFITDVNTSEVENLWK